MLIDKHRQKWTKAYRLRAGAGLWAPDNRCRNFRGDALACGPVPAPFLLLIAAPLVKNVP